MASRSKADPNADGAQLDFQAWRAFLVEGVKRTDWPPVEDGYWHVLQAALQRAGATKREGYEVVLRLAQMDLFLEQVISTTVGLIADVRAEAKAKAVPVAVGGSLADMKAACRDCPECHGVGSTIREFRSPDYPGRVSLAFRCLCSLGKWLHENDRLMWEPSYPGERRIGEPWLGAFVHLWDRSLSHPTWPEPSRTQRYFDHMTTGRGRELRLEAVPVGLPAEFRGEWTPDRLRALVRRVPSGPSAASATRAVAGEPPALARRAAAEPPPY